MSNVLKSMIALVILVVAASSTLYVVSETERGVKLRFGRLIEADIQPGLHVKIPFADDVRLFDARILTVDAPSASFFTAEKKRLIVDSYAKWRIANVETYYKATGGVETVAHNRLANRVNNGLRNQFGTRTLHEVVSGERDELMTNLAEQLDEVARIELGVEVVDVRVKKIDLPTDVSQSVYARMNTERDIEAREHRAQGYELGAGIRADADKQREIILAEAYSEAEEIRGSGDATSASIYASAYGKDREFYKFYRSMAAYQKTFSNKGDVLLVDPDSDFFSYLNNSKQ